MCNDKIKNVFGYCSKFLPIHIRYGKKIHHGCLNFKKYIFNRHSNQLPSKYILALCTRSSHPSCHSLKQLWKSSFMTFFIQCGQKYSTRGCWVVANGKAGLQTHYSMNLFTLFIESVLCEFCLFPNIKMNMKGQICFKKSIKRAMTVQSKTLIKEEPHFRNCFREQGKCIAIEAVFWGRKW